MLLFSLINNRGKHPARPCEKRSVPQSLKTLQGYSLIFLMNTRPLNG
ncbi:hypothetical protein CSB66_0912 [Enterobacter hormaechei]|nr:hypothetical protein HMPREF9086_3093 [Enterobacter hormaechei ATCC 49162]KHG54174.1 hypothetical protein T636_A3061 [Enterobacter hormaechei subsp. xiangfangensis]RAL75037.1 hypothetical protein CSC35_3586 [Enterobacter hormaechei]RCG80115.1 hypothetical protein CSB66_0912 [Enterobacter hormaechei]CDL33787.1 hypothetical protein [Enterobacter hormaechei]